jgi:hypothetical protein
VRTPSEYVQHAKVGIDVGMTELLSMPLLVGLEAGGPNDAPRHSTCVATKAPVREDIPPVLRWVCVEDSSKRALKSSTRTPGSEDKKTPGGLWLEGGIGQSRRRRTKPLGLRQVNPDKSGVN